MAQQHDGHGHDGHQRHGPGQGHGHGPGVHDGHVGLRGSGARGLIFILALTLAFMGFELFIFFQAHSLAVLAHLSHMLRDVAVIIMALFALWLSGRGSSAVFTFGRLRADVLAAMVNALSLWLIAGFIFFNALQRINPVTGSHEHVDIPGNLVLLVGCVGLVVNIVSAWVMHGASGQNLNLRGVFIHVLVDTMTTLGVILVGIVLIFFHWDVFDDYVSLAIGVLILISSWSLLANVIRVLMESAPEHIDVYKLCSEIEDIQGVTFIHDIHVWTIAPGYESLTAHIIVEPSLSNAETRALLDRVQDIARNEFKIDHITIQIDEPPVACTEEDHLNHLLGRTREDVSDAST